MKISTKGRYALRLMLDLALSDPGVPVPLRDVAQRQDISDKYLEQIVTQLSRAGLVRSVRGAGGGYLLTRDPAEYTVGEILRTLEVWREIQQAVSGVVDRITLADLVERQRRKAEGGCG